MLDDSSITGRKIVVNTMRNKNSSEVKEILINQLFAGSYLQEGSNIGHEVINLFRDDKGKNYLFITPSGNVIGHNVDSVLFVQNLEARETMEVVMKAEGLHEVSQEEIKDIFYAGISIIDIFSKNLYHGEIDTSQLDIFATYRADTIKFPVLGKRIILTVNPSYETEDKSATVVLIDPNKNKIVGQGMRTYLSRSTFPVAYNSVKNILDNDIFWEIENTTEKLLPDGSTNRSSSSFLEIIRKENDELIFSNLLAYYFNYNHNMFVKFAEEVLGIAKMSPQFEITRETMKKIDLWIEDKYFPDFLKGLKSHTMTLSELRFNIMRSRFLEKINQK